MPAFVLPFSYYYWTFVLAIGADGFLTGALKKHTLTTYLDRIFAGMVVGCASPVLVDMVGPQNISAAFSGILAFCGLSSLIGPPLAGDMVSSVRDSHAQVKLRSSSSQAQGPQSGLS